MSGFEPLPSGPRPVTGLSRRNGVCDFYQYVGDYTNPILKPEAAEVVKKHGRVPDCEQAGFLSWRKIRAHGGKSIVASASITRLVVAVMFFLSSPQCGLRRPA
jgi:hypothetical protein